MTGISDAVERGLLPCEEGGGSPLLFPRCNVGVVNLSRLGVQPATHVGRESGQRL